MMQRKKKAFDALFDCYVQEGKELGIMEAKRMYPRVLTEIRKATPGTDLRVVFSRMRKIYADRWHEIYDKKVNVVHEEPKKVSEPVRDPLEKLRTVSRKKVNE